MINFIFQTKTFHLINYMNVKEAAQYDRAVCKS